MTGDRAAPGTAPRRIAGVVFDKDGTLLDYAASWGPINRAAALLAAGGDPVRAADLIAFAGGEPETGRARPDTVLAAASTDEIAACFVAAGSRMSVAELTGRLDDLFRAAVGSVVPVTDLAQLFGRMKRRGLALGICSSDGAAAVAATAVRFGIDGLTDFVAGYDSGFGVKPGGGMVAAFCAATGIPPSAVAVVGDNRHDVEMGRAAGAGFVVGVLTGTGTRESLAAADAVVEDVLAFERLIGG